MSVISLTPASPRVVAVRRADDPFKKHWWTILAGFGLIGAWLFMPSAGPSVGSTHVDASSVAPSGADQSLDSVSNPSGAPGGALDQSRAGADRTAQAQKEAASMLYQAPALPGAVAAAGAPIIAGKGSFPSLAQQLKNAGSKTDSPGWGGEKAQRGFTAPALGAGLSTGSGSAHGGSTASMTPTSGTFGAHAVKATFDSADDLKNAGVGRQNAGLQALRDAAAPPPNAGAGAAAGQKGPRVVDLNEEVGGNSHAFDGALAHSGIGPEVGARKGSALAALEAAPADLKANPSDLGKLNNPPKAPPVAPATNSTHSVGNELMQSMLPILITGLVPGMGGALMAAAATTIMKHQQEAADAAKQSSQQKQNQAASGGNGSSQ